jgi:hypothetical protein
VAEQTDISASTFSHMGLDFTTPSAENLCRMLLWLGDTDMRPFLRTEESA